MDQIFDTFAAVSKVLCTAKTDVLMIDPYADEKMRWHYALSGPDQVQVRVLPDDYYYKQSLKPAAESGSTSSVQLVRWPCD